jgi:SAM-dependent methyltransferase
MPDQNKVTNCRGCQAKLPPPFLDLGKTPLANSYLTQDFSTQDEKSYPLALAYCPECFLVQLNYTVPPDQMFSDYLYFSSFSQSFLKHASEMADSLTERFGLGPDSRVLEIASNDGYLLQYFKQKGIQVMGVEPAKNIAVHAEKKGIPSLNVFFGTATAPMIRERFGLADVIIGNNVLAHVPETNGFFRSVYKCLKPGGSASFEFPYLIDLIKHREFDTIYHEHIFYFSLSAIKILAARAGLTLDHVEHQSVHGGSLRVLLGKETGVPASSAVETMLRDERRAGATSPEYYKKFSADVAELKEQFVGLLRELKSSGKRIAAYGAPAKGNTLLNYCGLGAETIDFTVDRSPHKQGLLLPGSHIPILEPDELYLRQPEYAVILPWNIKDEIISQQTEYLRSGGQFICPIPTAHVMSAPLAKPTATFAA